MADPSSSRNSLWQYCQRFNRHCHHLSRETRSEISTCEEKYPPLNTWARRWSSLCCRIHRATAVADQRPISLSLSLRWGGSKDKLLLPAALLISSIYILMMIHCCFAKIKNFEINLLKHDKFTILKILKYKFSFRIPCF